MKFQPDTIKNYYGIAISLCYVLTVIYWLNTKNIGAIFSLPAFIHYEIFSICWPFFQSCYPFGSGTLTLVYFLVSATVTLSVISIFFFIKKREKLAKSFLFFSFVILMGVYFLDYRMSMNQQQMIFWVTIAFLFSRDKITDLKFLIILFYFFAGLLKLNDEWLSGGALFFVPWPFTDSNIIWGTTFVVFLEIFFIWGVLSHKKIIFAFSFTSVVIFHLISWQIVGYYYPLLMLTLLSIYPLSYSQPMQWKNIRFPAVFVIFQLIPLSFSGDKALTGEGRVYALHMFDAQVSCNGLFSINENIYPLPIPQFIERRNSCDPIVYLSLGREFCRRNPSLNLGIQLNSKKMSSDEAYTILDISNFCQKNISYNLFTKNKWIWGSAI